MLLWAKGISALLGRDKHGETVHKTTTRDVLELIKKVVLEEAERLGIRVEKIILFGSRARGDYREDSDWDILVIIGDNKLDRRIRRLLSARIGARAAHELLVSVDVIVTTRERWKRYSRVVGTIEEVAASEGVPL